MWDILPCTLYKWYRDHLSDYLPDKSSGKWPAKFIEKIDQTTGEVVQGKPVVVFKPDNFGEKMSIDDKAIGHEGYTILSNTQTGKIAMMIESVKGKELEEALSLFGRNLSKIRSISMDMSPTYFKLCYEQMPYAQIVIDKFHVMKYVYEAVLEVRSNTKKELAEALSKGKLKTENDKEILCELALLNRCRNRLTQSPDKWSDAIKELMEQIFSKHKKLKLAYILSQKFKDWYNRTNYFDDKTQIQNKLSLWYSEVKKSELKEFYSVAKMIRKHENEILNYFFCGHTNANAERLNGKIQRFVSANYGTRDKDFALYRIAGYFS
jgi:transposase